MTEFGLRQAPECEWFDHLAVVEEAEDSQQVGVDKASCQHAEEAEAASSRSAVAEAASHLEEEGTVQALQAEGGTRRHTAP